jgi:glycosyltransferase involved in cell wall biosynthesis
MKIIFHHPLPLDANKDSASGIRPALIKQGFEDCGCSVEVVAGYSQERRQAVEQIKASIRSGRGYDFMYSESSTMPTLLTDPHHLPLHPRLDFGFFAFLKKHNVNIGLFYRDIYWRFDDYARSVNGLKARVAKFFYRYDLRQYDKWVDRLYLPSLEMGKHLPEFDSARLAELPPGHANTMQNSSEISPMDRDGRLRLLYVGGMAHHYQMHELFQAVKKNPRVQLTICTRPAEWQAIKPEYAPFLADNINIVHLNGDGLIDLYQQADLAALYVAPQTYREFAVPFKLFEYLGHQKPIIASEGTLAGDFVLRNRIGWTLPYRSEDCGNLLQKLLDQPPLLAEAKTHCAQVAKSHTWAARARQVINDLQELRFRNENRNRNQIESPHYGKACS